MQGKLNRSTFETPDGHRYYRLKSDALQTKLYFRCRMYTKGCRVILHTEYVGWDDDDLKVISTSGIHNHGFNQNSSECGVGHGRKRRYARVEADDEDTELEDEEEDDDEDGDGGESDDGEDSEEDEDDEEEESGEDEEEDEETEDDKKCRYSYGLVILNSCFLSIFKLAKKKFDSKLPL